MAGLALIFSAGFMVGHSYGWSDWEFWLRGFERWNQTLSRPEMMGAYVLLLSSDLFLPVPSSIVMTLGGSHWGWLLGTVLNFSGAMGGAGVGYMACRSFGAGFFRRFAGTQDEEIQKWFLTHGKWGILFSRSVPMLAEVVSCVAGLTRMPFLTFFRYVALGSLPVSAIYATMGHMARETQSLLLHLVSSLGLPLVAYLLLHAFMPRKTPARPSGDDHSF